jgi:D-xylose transport system ATP-binding protein
MPLLSLTNITKEFPGVRALNGVSINADAGQIHALVGENGAGKSTLIKIIGGVYPYGSYGGQVLIDGREVHFHSVHDSEGAQVQIIHQELSLVNQMTVAENICLGSEQMRGGMIDFTAMRLRAKQALQSLSGAISPDDRISDLTIGQQQIVEIAKALSKKARIIVFDEPTAALPEHDVAHLLALIKSLRNDGLGIIYISHKLNEVIELADVITVLRNGERVSEFVRGKVLIPDMVRDMVGRSLDTVYPALKPAGNESVLSLDKISLPHPENPGKMIIKELSFECARGEILGLAGLLGSGRTALLSLLFGAFRGAHSGTLRFDGQPYFPQNPNDAIKRGISLVTEDRKRYGLIDVSDVQENLHISSLRRYCSHGVINNAKSFAECQGYVRKLSIKTPSLSFPVLNLSGGNQQKVIVGRFLMTAPRLLLLDDPTRGIDVGAKYELYRLIQQLAETGMGIIFVSSELPEVLGVSHRVIVLHQGTIAAQFKHGEKNEEEVLALAAGV